ncbi:MAG: sensor histidine kinase [Clostridiales Family XIII bacterium]|jgi:signal transduction histidine kinase|nr:sensor histidine kinase [Clostridiales Family XIII bacterium]
MRFFDFLRGKVAFLALVFVVACFSALLLYAVRADLYFAMFIPCLLFFGSIVSLLPEFFVKKRFYDELLSIVRQMDKPHLLQELIECPGFIEGAILYDSMKTAGKSMNDEIAQYKTAFTEYREYIELWIHEVKTPIAGAKLISENAHNKTALEALEKIESYVEQALYYARSNAVEKDYLLNPVRLSELVGNALKSNSRFLIGHDIAVHMDDLDREVLTDTKWLTFIIRQLIDNAVKYGGSTLEFYGEQRADGATLYIRDDGVGIPEQDVGRVFLKGFTGANGREYGSSTGFGLYLCKKLCGKLGLGISLTSERGQGTTIAIFFPKSDD